MNKLFDFEGMSDDGIGKSSEEGSQSGKKEWKSGQIEVGKT